MPAPRLHARTVAIDPPVLCDLLHARDGLAWLVGDDGLVAWGTAARFEAGTGRGRFRRSSEWFGARSGDVDDPVRLPGTGLVAFGSFTFADSSPGSLLTIPEHVVGRRDGAAWHTRISTDGAAPGPVPGPESVPTRQPDRPRYAGASVPDHRWLELVATALRRVETGAIDKVVLARDHALWAREPFDVRTLARRLADRFPSCMTFVVEGLVGATPELLVRRVGRDVTSVVLAGTAGRGDGDAADAAVAAALLASDKDRREHAWAATSVREVLAPLTHGLVEDGPAVMRLDNVHHLATRFTATLVAAPSALDLAGTLHPTAAVGGAPTAAALRSIADLEGMDRGRYAGPVGWVDHRGDGEFGLALRCAELSGARARLFAGAGIVRGSDPADELEETRLKLQAMRTALDA